MIKNLAGKLELEQDGYILEKVNISKLFDEVYKSNNKVIGVKIFKDGRLYCAEDGILVKDTNDCGMKVYFINGLCIEDKLWNLIDNNINVEIWVAEDKKVYGK